ncbi:hypothetical protein [Parvularcula lutaonensis]|uniref:SRPBCC domain-containing protein n=1 Tax=Parvularcula lutaonensis TaxID=491923 RepID=A0ABV7M7U6_9PROT|nr:hypothetical protein [Parvularcula lutaonensis]GGY42349.1 hypothetical protein GCM10007148_08750 [Parvularcula lutaonensis]
MTAEVVLSTYLDASADEVWEHATKPRVLHYVASPMIAFEAINPPAFPERWETGDYLCAMKLAGVLPIGQQVIGISYPPAEGGKRFLRDDGHSASIKRWDHWVTIEPEGEGTRYEDRLTLDAGWRTPVVAAFARSFYSHRQARWRELVASGFRYGDGS